ncbi:hypothetical protein EG328_009981 [Venturia inaequalis]|uniref:BTB domain-containing protein n=1 Tax=Venturia inaequalis TaxID=5025 RepID=A0A8H3YLL7_VENIN|nr:hypothetical protein EG328_009981 [Venturia inaequalis]
MKKAKRPLLPEDVDTSASFKKRLSRRFNSTEFADLTITCRDQTFSAHKVLISAHSPVLHNALKSGTFKESETEIIDLPHDDPILVKAMIKFMYEFKYDDSKIGDPTANLLFHAKIASMADKYDIQPMKELAIANFRLKAEVERNESVLAAIQAAYNVEGVNELKSAAVILALKWSEYLFGMQEFENFMDENGEFGKEFVKHVLLDAKQYRRRRYGGLINCTCELGCQLDFMINVLDVDSYTSEPYLKQDMGKFWCKCPRDGCEEDTAGIAYQIGIGASLHCEGWFKYLCPEKNCKKVIYCRHEKEELEEEESLLIVCPACESSMKLKGPEVA